MSGIGNIANNFDFRTLSQPIAAEKEGGWKKFGRILGGVASAAAAPMDPVGAEGGEMARTLQKFLAYGLL